MNSRLKSQLYKGQDSAETTHFAGQFPSLSSQYLPVGLLGGPKKEHPAHCLIYKCLVAAVFHFYLKVKVSYQV